MDNELILDCLTELFAKEERASYRANTAINWKRFIESGNRFKSFFDRNGFLRAVIYGYGILGKELAEELESDGIKIEFIIDKKGSSIDSKYPVFLMNEEQWLNYPGVFYHDLVFIVTVSDFNKIRDYFWVKGIKSVISLEELTRWRGI